MSFRYSQVEFQDWISYIGIVLLNEKFQFISEPELLPNTTRR